MSRSKKAKSKKTTSKTKAVAKKNITKKKASLAESKKKTAKKPITPSLTVDIIIEMSNEKIVLIERKFKPYGWALPGGFVDVGETVEDAAIREAKEETSLEVKLVKLLGVYSDPCRDTRMHTVSVVYIATAKGTPRAADDAKNLKLYSLDRLPDLAFDHAKILVDYSMS